MEMEANKQELITTLNDLVRINNDRIIGYRKAAAQVKRNDQLKTLFEEKASHSVNFVQELKAHIERAGGSHTKATTISGRIYRGWMDIRNALRPGNAPTILDSCTFGEEAAVKAYELALKSGCLTDPELLKQITDQKESIQASIDQWEEISMNLNKILL
jgi:uncharacterized protein (TIGR02284 family)